MFNNFFGEGDMKSVTKWATISLIVFSVFLVVKVITDFKRLPNVGKEVYPQSTIMVTGKGEAYAIPDIASFSFSVVETSKTVDAAQKLLDEKVAKALGVLKEAEIADKDVKTTSYNVYPKYEWKDIVCISYPCASGKNELVGYEVNQSITVKVRDVKKVGDLVNKIGAVDVSNISGVEFTVDNREEFVAKARAEAIAEAKVKAKELAKQLGVRLGDIIYYNDNGDYPMYGEAMGMGGGADMMKSVAVPTKAELPQGEAKITASVSITYEIR